MIKNILKNKIILSIILIIFLFGSVFLIQKFLIPYIHYMLLPREKIDLSGIDKATICFYESIYLEETDEYVRNKLFEIDYKIPNTLAEGLQKNKFINYNNDNTVSVLDDFKQPNHEVILNSHNKFYFHYVYEWANSLSKDSNRNSYVTWYNDDKSFKTSVPTYFITSLVVDIDDFLETNYEENFATTDLTISSKGITKELNGYGSVVSLLSECKYILETDKVSKGEKQFDLNFHNGTQLEIYEPTGYEVLGKLVKQDGTIKNVHIPYNLFLYLENFFK